MQSCTYCNKVEHGSLECERNPYSDTCFTRCKKFGHSEETFWSRTKNIVPLRASARPHGVREKSRQHVSTAMGGPGENLATTKSHRDGQPVEKEARAVGINFQRILHPRMANPIPNIIKYNTA